MTTITDITPNSETAHQGAAPDSTLTELKSLFMPDMAVMTRRANAQLRMVASFTITSDDDYQLAGEELGTIKGRWNAMEAARTAITGPMNKALKAVNDLFRAPMATLVQAEGEIKARMLTYSTEQELIAEAKRKADQAIADAEQARLAAAARAVEQAAAAERQRIADVAAAQAAVAKDKQDRMNKIAADAAAAGDKAASDAAAAAAQAVAEAAAVVARQQRELDAEAAEVAHQSAAALRHEASVLSAPVAHVALVKSSGTSVRTATDFEVTNLPEFIKHIAAHPELMGLLQPDSIKLRAYVKGLGMNAKMPGLNVFHKKTMSARAA
jgi:colicin import membrane protein